MTYLVLLSQKIENDTAVTLPVMAGTIDARRGSDLGPKIDQMIAVGRKQGLFSEDRVDLKVVEADGKQMIATRPVVNKDV